MCKESKWTQEYIKRWRTGLLNQNKNICKNFQVNIVFDSLSIESKKKKLVSVDPAVSITVAQSVEFENRNCNNAIPRYGAGKLPRKSSGKWAH